MITLYAKKQPTTDSVSIEHGLKHKNDTVVYRNPECTEQVARWPWHYSKCPRRGQKKVTLNCFQYLLAWAA